MRGESGLTASDVALLSGRNGNNDGFGDNGSWWVIIFLIFAFMGWGRNNNGFGGFGGSGVADNYVLATDFATIERKLDSVNSGLCDGFYAMAQQFSNTNQNIANSTANLQQTLCQGFSGVNQAIVSNGYETRLGVNALSSQLANCCCDIRQQISDCCCQTQRSIDNVRFENAQNTCAITNTINNTTRDILESNNNNTRAILDFLTQDKISTLTAENQALKFQASQTAQNAFITANQDAQTAELIRRLGADCPVNAYVVQPPTPVTFPTNCCGQFTGYGCNNNCGNY